MDGIGSWVSMGEKSGVCSTFVRWKWWRGNKLQGRDIFQSVGELFFFSRLKGQKGNAKRRNKNEFNPSDTGCRISNDWTKTHHFWRHDFCQPSSRVCAETRIRERRSRFCKFPKRRIGETHFCSLARRSICGGVDVLGGLVTQAFHPPFSTSLLLKVMKEVG